MHFNMNDDAINKETERAMSHIFTSSASSAAVERVFFTFRLIQSALRNRLRNETESKLGLLLSFI